MTGVVSREVLLAQGWTPSKITAAVAKGRLTRVDRGVYSFDGQVDPWDAYRRRVVAAAMVGWASGAPGTSAVGVASHHSAAAIHRIPMLFPEYRRVHITLRSGRGGGRAGDRHRHPRPLRDQDVVVVDGAPTTSRARTAVDLAAVGSFEQGVCVLDAVRRRPRFPRRDHPAPVELDELNGCVESLAGTAGIARARRALAASTDLSESVR